MLVLGGCGFTVTGSEENVKFEYGTVMDVRGISRTKFLIETESGQRIFIHSNKPLMVGDEVVVKRVKDKYRLSSEEEKAITITDTEDKTIFYNVIVKNHNGNIKEYRHCLVKESGKYTQIRMINPYNEDPDIYTPLDDTVLWIDNEECEIEMMVIEG